MWNRPDGVRWRTSISSSSTGHSIPMHSSSNHSTTTCRSPRIILGFTSIRCITEPTVPANHHSLRRRCSIRRNTPKPATSILKCSDITRITSPRRATARSTIPRLCSILRRCGWNEGIAVEKKAWFNSYIQISGNHGREQWSPLVVCFLFCSFVVLLDQCGVNPTCKYISSYSLFAYTMSPNLPLPRYTVHIHNDYPPLFLFFFWPPLAESISLFRFVLDVILTMI